MSIIEELTEKLKKLETIFQPWLSEFSDSAVADELTDYQKENGGIMISQLLNGMTREEAPPENWTPEVVVKAIVEDICKNYLEEPPYFENFPIVLVAFFSFLAEKGYIPEGKHIAEAILDAKEDIRQTEEDQQIIRFRQEVIQEAVEKGVDIYDQEQLATFVEDWVHRNDVLEEFHRQLDEGKEVNEIFDQFTEEERQIVMDDMPDFSLQIDPEVAGRGMEKVNQHLAEGKTLDEALEMLTPEEANNIVGMLQESLKKNPEKKPSLFDLPKQSTYQETKISRNAPCPCGSGKKYKRCCGRK